LNKVEKVQESLSDTNLLISELIVEVVAQCQLAGDMNDNDQKKIKILSQAVIEISDLERKFLDFS